MYEFRDFGLNELTDGRVERKIYHVLEYAEVGSLYDLLMKGGLQDERFCRFYMKKLFSAVEFLHSQQYYHRDIKPLNILIKNDEHVIKLGDFGMMIDGNKPEFTGRLTRDQGLSAGTSDYRALDVFNIDGHLPGPVDVFACGVVMFATMFGYEPFFREALAPGRHPLYAYV